MPNVARKTIALPSFQRVATLVPTSLDPAGRSIDVIWTTGAQVRRQGFWDDEPWIEELSLEPGAVDLSRLNAGAPVLDSHGGWGKGIRAILGAVEPGSARIEPYGTGKIGLARLHFSQRAEVADLVDDIKAGIIRSLSCSYQIDELNEVRPANRKRKEIALYRADRWTPDELSFVAVGADPGAQIRAAEPTTHRCYVTRRSVMPDDLQEETTLPTVPGSRAVERPPADAPKPKEAEPEPNTLPDDDEDEGEHEPKSAQTARALRAERKRIAEIRESVRGGGLPETFADDFIEKGTASGDVARAVLQELARKQPAISRSAGVEVVASQGLKRLAEGMYHALMTRIAPERIAEAMGKLPEARQAEITNAAEEWKSRRLLEMGRACLEARGVHLRGLGPMDMAAYCLGLNREGPHGFITTSDFPLLLAQIARTQLLAGYQMAPRTFPPWCRQGTLPDFRITNKVSVGLGPKLLKIPEHSEYKRGMLMATLAQAQLEKYGRILAFTREALINDDLGLFQRIPSMFGNAAAAMESDIVYGILMGNPPMGDGQPLFSAAHGNLMTASTININSINAARLAMIRQTSMDGHFLTITPQFLIVGPEQELSALQFLAPITIVGTTQNLVPRAYQSLQLIVEPRITDASWYLAANPNQFDTIEYDFLEGAAGGGPTIETREGWDIDGTEYKAREEFAATAVDFRGLVKNPGELPTFTGAAGALAAPASDVSGGPGTHAIGGDPTAPTHGRHR